MMTTNTLLQNTGMRIPKPRTRVMQTLFIACLSTLSVLAARPAHAGEIVGFGGAFGPGLGSVVTPAWGTSDPSNDNVPGASLNALIISQKRFDNVAIIDMVFSVSVGTPSATGSTTTEYQVREFVYNDTGVDWTGHNVQLGYGVGSSFVLSTPGDGLDFDAPDVDSLFAFGPYTTTTLGVDVMTMSGGTVAAGDFFVLEFAMDVPNLVGTSEFTIRQLVVVPEPGTAVLMMLGLSVLASRKSAAA